MPDVSYPYYVVLQCLKDGRFLAEALLFGEISCAGRSVDDVLTRLDRRVREVAESEEAHRWYQRFPAERPTLQTVNFELDSARELTHWREQLSLRFDCVVWRHTGQGHLAFVPSVGIEVFVEDERALSETL